MKGMKIHIHKFVSIFLVMCLFMTTPGSISVQTVYADEGESISETVENQEVESEEQIATNDEAPEVEEQHQVLQTSQVVYITREDNLNDAGEEISDNDLGVTIENYEGDAQDIEFNINVSGLLPEISAKLLIRAFDVDEESGELNKVFFNDTFIGYLTGENNTFSTSKFTISKELINQGNNTIKIELAEHFSLTVESGQLVFGSGSEQYGKIEDITGELNDEGVFNPDIQLTGVVSDRDYIIEMNAIDEFGYNYSIEQSEFRSTSDSDFDFNQLKFKYLPEGQYIIEVFFYDKESGELQSEKSIEISPSEIIKWSQVADNAQEGTDYTINGGTIYINSPLGLAWVAKQINSGSASGVTIQLVNDLDISQYEWTPIGALNQFDGNFNGDGYTISGLKIGKEETPNNSFASIGLFNTIGKNGVVSEVTVKTDGIYSSYAEYEDNLSVGVLVGKNYGIIQQCITLGNIQCGDANQGTIYCGGIAGKNYGTIQESKSQSNVTAGDAKEDEIKIGGIVGKNQGTVQGVHSEGDVTVGDAKEEQIQIGGFIGENEEGAYIVKSYATGNVRAGNSIDSRIYIGGFVGINDKSAIVNNYATGNVTAGDALDDEIEIGGFVGSSEDSYIGNSYATGNVTAGNIEGEREYCIGGFAGNNEDSYIGNSYATGNVTAGSITDEGEFCIGGFVGKNDGDIECVYYNSDGKQIVDGTESSSNDECEEVIPKSSNEMKSNEFKELLNNNRKNCNSPQDLEFDFNFDVDFFGWKRADDKNNGYPELLGLDGQVTYNISGIVTSNSSFLTDAIVVLKQGIKEIDRTTTNGSGEYSFMGLSNGAYNLVVTKDGKIVTSLINIRNADVNKNIYLTDGNKNSVLELTGSDTPSIVVGGLDEIAKITSGMEVKIKMTVEKQAENMATNSVEIKNSAKGKTLDFLDMKLTKTVDGNSEGLSQLEKVLEIVIPYDFNNKTNISVYRYHETEVNSFTELDSKPMINFVDGTYYLDKENNCVYIYANKFSTYAIGYQTMNQKVITFDANGGEVTLSNMLTNDSKNLESLPIPTRSGKYRFNGWFTSKDGGVKVTTDTIFESDTTIFAQWSSKSSSSNYVENNYFDIHIKINGEGTITPDGGSNNVLEVREESDQVFIINAKENYIISDVLIDEKSVGPVKEYIFKNINKNHTIQAVFEKKPVDEINEFKPKSSVEKENPFTDVINQDWFYEEVLMVLEKGIMSGTSDTKFSPHTGTSRAMIATILHRIENKPSHTQKSPFYDVLEGQWYADGISWCAENGIVKGYGEGIYKPNQIITREELCAILYRYAEYKGLDMSKKAELSNFIDEKQIGSWAKGSVSVVVEMKLLKGNDRNQLQPKKQATRAEVAAVILNLLQLIES